MTSTPIQFKQATFLGVPALVAKVKLPGGQRIQVTWWYADSVGQPTVHAAGTAIVRRVSGDGRVASGSKALQVHAEAALPDATVGSIKRAVAAML